MRVERAAGERADYGPAAHREIVSVVADAEQVTERVATARGELPQAVEVM
jgi:hypothetical protein